MSETISDLVNTDYQGHLNPFGSEDSCGFLTLEHAGAQSRPQIAALMGSVSVFCLLRRCLGFSASDKTADRYGVNAFIERNCF